MLTQSHIRLLAGIYIGVFFLSAFSATVLATECEKTRQLTYDGFSSRLVSGAKSPNSLSLAERYCLVGVAGQIAGLLPSGLESLSSRRNADLDRALSKISPTMSSERAIDAGATFSVLQSKVSALCTDEVRHIPASDLTPDRASACGLIRLPGTPLGLGKRTAKYESGSLEGGYASISPDPGAGGWTYGKYQLASLAGGIEGFLGALMCSGASSCLSEGYRSIGQRLIDAGGLDGARNRTVAFASAWTELALNDRRMQQAQESYQTITSWEPTQRLFAREFEIDLASASCGLREQAFSARTQHSVESTKRIFSEAVRVVGKFDHSAIVIEANKYRISLLGQPGGFYAKYGAICERRQPPDAETSINYSCSYLNGVRTRWTAESRELSMLKSTECP